MVEVYKAIILVAVSLGTNDMFIILKCTYSVILITIVQNLFL